MKGLWSQKLTVGVAPSDTTWEKLRHLGVYASKMAYQSQSEKMVTLSGSWPFRFSPHSYLFVSLRIPKGKSYGDGNLLLGEEEAAGYRGVPCPIFPYYLAEAHVPLTAGFLSNDVLSMAFEISLGASLFSPPKRGVTVYFK